MPQAASDDGGPVLLGHGLGERCHLVDVGDATFGHPVGAATLDPARVLQDEVVEDGGVEDRLEQPVGGAGDAGSLGGEVGVPGADLDRCDLRQFPLSEGGLEACW